jgi:hypothetical protein
MDGYRDMPPGLVKTELVELTEKARQLPAHCLNRPIVIDFIAPPCLELK